MGALTSTHFVLRDLPLAPRVVISVFLISVGLGYFSALVQLHFKHSSAGNAMPLPADVVAHFSGKVWPPPPEDTSESAATPPRQPTAPPLVPLASGDDPALKVRTLIEARCVRCHGPGGKQAAKGMETWDKLQKYLKPEGSDPSQFETLVSAPESEPFGGEGSMAHAFTTKSGEWDKDQEAQLRPEREGERDALLAWVKAGAPREAYDGDHFTLSNWGNKPITSRFLCGAAEVSETVASSAIPGCDPIKEAIRRAKAKQITVENLTQSTHVHMLGFAMLYFLTGLMLSNSSYPGWLRLLLAPLTLLAQVVDISCWWLARLDGVGPYFALAIMGTGGIVGATLFMQIVLTLIDLFGKEGKAVLAILFLTGLGGFMGLYLKVIDPILEEQRVEAQAEKVRQEQADHDKQQKVQKDAEVRKAQEARTKAEEAKKKAEAERRQADQAKREAQSQAEEAKRQAEQIQGAVEAALAKAKRSADQETTIKIQAAVEQVEKARAREFAALRAELEQLKQRMPSLPVEKLQPLPQKQ